MTTWNVLKSFTVEVVVQVQTVDEIDVDDLAIADVADEEFGDAELERLINIGLGRDDVSIVSVYSDTVDVWEDDVDIWEDEKK